MEEELECLASMYPELVLDSKSSGSIAVESHEHPTVKLTFALKDGYPETAGSCSVALSCDEMSRVQALQLNEWTQTWLSEASGYEMQLLGLVVALPESFSSINELNCDKKDADTIFTPGAGISSLTLERAERQVTEIRKLEESSHCRAMVIDTPKLLERLKECVSSSAMPSSTTKQLGVSLLLGKLSTALLHKWCDVIIEISLPLGYPDSESCEHSFKSEKFSQACMDHCNTALRARLQPFTGKESLLAVVNFLVGDGGGLINDALAAAAKGGEGGQEAGKDCTIIR
jgi:hypothetical protein